MKRMPLAMEWAHPNQCFQQIFFFPLWVSWRNFAPPVSLRAHSKETMSINTLPCEPPLWNGGSIGEGWGRLDPSPLGSLLTWKCSVFWLGHVILLGLSVLNIVMIMAIMQMVTGTGVYWEPGCARRRMRSSESLIKGGFLVSFVVAMCMCMWLVYVHFTDEGKDA